MTKAVSRLSMLVLLFMSATVYAYEVIDAHSVNVTAKYTEPTQNTDNSPLTNLKHVNIYYNIGNGEKLGITNPASSPRGGGTVTVKFPVPVPDGAKVDVMFYSRAINSTGQQSSKSGSVKLTIDRHK